jgi:hypothetical protein
MRNRDVIVREIDRARVSLQMSLGELKHVIQDKLDIRAHARRAIEHKKDDAKIALIHGKNYVVALAKRGAERGKDGAMVAYKRTSATVRARPFLFASILAGVLAATAAIVIVQFRRSHRSLV